MDGTVAGKVNSNNKPLLIGVTGGTASGKTSLCRYLLTFHHFYHMYFNSLGYKNSRKDQTKHYPRGLRLFLQGTFVSHDFIIVGGRDEEHDDASNYNFDHPNALDFDLAYKVLLKLLAGQDADLPLYDFTSHQR